MAYATPLMKAVDVVKVLNFGYMHVRELEDSRNF